VTNRAFLLLSTNIFSWFIANLFLPDKTVEPLHSSPSCSTVLDDIIDLHTDSAAVSASSRTTTDRNIAEKLFTMIPLIRHHSLGSQHAPRSDMQKGELADFLPDFFFASSTRSPSAPQRLRDGAAVQNSQCLDLHGRAYINVGSQQTFPQDFNGSMIQIRTTHQLLLTYSFMVHSRPGSVFVFLYFVFRLVRKRIGSYVNLWCWS
jgi:hypothetical protein